MIGPPATCIYCAMNPPNGREHWFPAWLGQYRGVEQLHDRICDECNQRLGKMLDQEMSRTGPQAAARYHLQIEGKHTHWAKANPIFYRSQGIEPPTTATTAFPDLPFAPIMEDIPGSQPIERRCARQIVVQRHSGELVPVRVPDGISPEWLAKAVEERELVGGMLVHIVCEAENRTDTKPQGEPPQWFRKAMGSVFPNATNIAWSVADGGPNITLPSPTVFGLSGPYVRALAKVGFHYLLAFDGAVNGFEEEFRPLRDFILRGQGNWQDFVDLNSRMFVMGKKAPESVVHVLMLETASLISKGDAGSVLQVRLLFFFGHTYAAAPVKITLGRDPVVRTLRMGHLLRLFDEPTDGYDGELKILSASRHPREGLWGVEV